MVHLIQCLCPLRHAIMAVAYDADNADTSPDLTMKGFVMVVDQGIELKLIGRTCAICGAPRERWKFEDQETPFQTLEDAKPPLEECERRQMATRQMFQQSKN